MATELRRGLIRITANYSRLLSMLVIGIISVPILLKAVGTECFGLISLIVGATGLALIINDTVRTSLTYEVGRALHSGDDQEFREIYAAANVVCLLVAVITSVVFMGFYFAAPLFKIDESLLDSARLLILYQMADNLFRTMTAAPRQFIMITERFLEQSFFQVLRRAAILVGAVAALVVYKGEHYEKALVLFATVQVGMTMLVQLLSVLWAFYIERKSIPRLRSCTRRALKQVVGTAKWNAAAVGASSIQIQVDQLLMNVFFGLYGNAMFGIAQRLAGYIRMIVNGMSIGIDAVTVRLSAGQDSGAMSIREFMLHSTRLHAVALMPALCYLLLFAGQVLHVWISRTVEDPERSVHTAMLLVSVLFFGMASRAMSDNWTSILYGAGHVRKYAPLVIIGSVLNPILAVALYFTLPGGWNIVSPAAGFTISMVAFHFIGIPIKVARCFEMPLREVFSPMLRPLVLAVVCLPVPLLFSAGAGQWGVTRLFLSMAAYSLVYTTLCGMFELHTDERQRIITAIRRRLPIRA
ncbi:MAG: hypothetical protein H6814_00415 [Phycisphaeraceae bacterium]|nr:hypothetical protein [Phycisphaeraceae bacterium]